MTVGCVICSEPFSSLDDADKYPIYTKSCGHVFHMDCLKQWLAKSRTCPVCRAETKDCTTSISRLHLQSVNSLNISDSCQPQIAAVQAQEIADLRKELSDSKSTINRIQKYVDDVKRCLSHIEIELKSKNNSSIITIEDNSPSLPAPAPAASTASRLLNRAMIARPSTTTVRARQSTLRLPRATATRPQ